MKKIAAWLDAHPSFALALSAVFTASGVVLGSPASGLAATLPVSFCLFLAAAWVRRGAIFSAVLTAVLSLAYGFGLGIASPFVFAGASVLSVLAAAGAVALVRLARRRKKALLFLPALVLTAGGILLPFLTCGTPSGYLAAGQDTRDYLAKRYPDQTFTRVVTYRDPAAKAWHADVSYTYEGNALTSVVLFGDTVTDGFLADRMAFSQETRRSTLIEALRTGEESILVEPDGFSGDLTARDVVPGVYGAYDQALEGEMCFSLTFRKEKTQKRDFALAIRDAMAILKDAGIDYHRIRFVALSAGEPVYECSVAPDTPQEELLDLITRT